MIFSWQVLIVFGIRFFQFKFGSFGFFKSFEGLECDEALFCRHDIGIGLCRKIADVRAKLGF